MGKTVIKSFNGGKLPAKDYIDFRLNNTVKEKFDPRGMSAPAPGLYTCNNHYFQTSSSLKPLGQSSPNFMWSLLGKGERKFI